MMTSKLWQEYITVEAQSQQIQQDLSEATHVRDDVQVAFLRDLVLLLGQKQLLLLEEDLVYLRAKAAGIKIPDVEAEAVNNSPGTPLVNNLAFVEGSCCSPGGWQLVVSFLHLCRSVLRRWVLRNS
ncbi:hypothetical protein ABBQ38_013081 [Trebouxia sp. C0009 RCD-2024]